MEFEMMSITTEKKNQELVRLLTNMLRACDGETINYVLEQSGQAEYAFESILRTKESLREHVGCLDNVTDLTTLVLTTLVEMDKLKEEVKKLKQDLNEATINSFQNLNR